MSDDVEESPYRKGYPEPLAKAEMAFISVSRKGRLPDPPAEFSIPDCTGIGLSGGGIRSATFCLGVFQGLAKLRLLRKIDFLSTVSGGGYFGSFYTRFFLRSEVKSFSFVEETLDADCPTGKTPYQRNIITWLRENGRYLSPRGSGDLLLAGAVLLRNWVVVQFVLGLLFLLVFLTAQALRLPIDTPRFHFELDSWFRQLHFLKDADSELVINLPGRLQLWVTPLVIVPEAIFLLAAVPFGWAYWIVGRHTHVKEKSHFFSHPITGVAFVIVVAGIAFLYGDAYRTAAAGVLLVTAITLLSALASLPKERQGQEIKAEEVPLRDSYCDELSRNRVSAQLKGALVLAVASLAFVAVDSLGQTIYLVLLTPGATFKSWAAGVVALIVALAPFANRIMIFLRGANGGKRPKGLSTFAATVAAFLVIGTLLTAISVGANAIAWKLSRPAYAPLKIGEAQLPTLSRAGVLPDKDQPNQWRMAAEEPPPPPPDAPLRDRKAVGGAWLITLALSFLFGQSWPFLNRSTQLPLYSARLTRAYLGASNPRRTGKAPAGSHSGGAVTRVIPGDDSEVEAYWPWPPAPDQEQGARAAAAARQEKIYRHGAPLHLINVTVNETLDGKSQVQQQDRKGIGMAVGPAGISAGVRHHAIFDRARERLLTFPRKGFKVFNYGQEGSPFTGERLPVGQWLSISGAAFSTGLGARTSLALSLLTGVGNIRLGYWWDSGVAPETRPERERPIASRLIGGIFTRIFPVQSYLLDEYTARYHGTARKEWYLTDGGHFENMAGYELIRRRLRLIIIIDSEADPDYNFGGLAGLIRKARIDFGAEISFLDDQRLDEVMEGHPHPFSTLDNLRRGKWVEERTPALSKGEARRVLDPVDYARFSLAHAAIATVTYDGKSHPESCLLYIKPTLVGSEPLDILQYHVENPTFPQETTMDQFFDEAQWESYRRLGQHIAKMVFKAPEGREAGEWWESRVTEVLKTPVKGCSAPNSGTSQ